MGVIYFFLVIFYLFTENDLAFSFKDTARFLFLNSSKWELGAPRFAYFPAYNFFDSFSPYYYDLVVEGRHHINFFATCCFKHTNCRWLLPSTNLQSIKYVFSFYNNYAPFVANFFYKKPSYEHD